MPRFSAFIALFSTIVFAVTATAGDWPMWRYDSGRGGSTPHGLPDELHLHWTRQLPEPAPAWPVEQAKLQFDLQAEPVVMGERIFVPSSREDRVTAYSTRTGEELWRFYADGPVRLAPVAHEGRVFFNADDGFLYAVDAASGELIWKRNGGPKRRLILGNGRLISSWPARGGVVLHEGRLYFAASIWPFMGIFIHAVDPATGEVVWTNSGDGTNWTVQPHNAPSFAGVVPQGHLAAAGGKLVVPGGRSTPAVYDALTGELSHFRFDKRNGGHNVGAVGELLFCAGHAYTIAEGSPVGGGAPAIFDREVLVASDPASILVRDANVEFKTRKTVDRKGRTITETAPSFREKSQTRLKGAIPGRWRLKAGNRLYAGGAGRIAAYEIGKAEPVWEAKIEGEVYTVLAADDRLFVVTREGLLHCFGAETRPNVAHHNAKQSAKRESDAWTAKTRRILETSGATSGFALVLGLDSGRLVEELVAQSQLHVIAVDPDTAKIEALRRRLTEAGVYGTRAAAFAGNPATEPFPPYFCRLIVSETAGNLAQTANVTEALRPYGGVIMLGSEIVLHRDGPLPEIDDWTHQYANAAQTAVSRDRRVKAPFGVLWFGGPSHAGILPRHGHGPSPQVAGGRLFIEGPDLLRAVDVYTGQLLWEADLPGFGQYYNRTDHFAGAGEIGSNYVSLPDRIYAVYGDAILELDAETGLTQRKFQLEPDTFFGHVSVSGDFLVATAAPVDASGKKPAREEKLPPGFGALIPPQAEWRYQAGNDAPANWMGADFDAKTWKTGRAGFGYGDGDDATTIDMRGKFSRVRIRREFEVKEAAELMLRINYDDGFVAYLNGQEVARQGVSKSGVVSHEAGDFENFELGNRRLRIGKNVLAIEGFNRSSGSSDFTLDPILLARTATPKPAADERPSDVELPTARYAPGSRILAVFDRKSGELLWQREARFNFRHNNIAVSADRVFCIDSMTSSRASALSRRGVRLAGQPQLLALDLRTGAEHWKQTEDVFGTFLNYSAEHDILLQAGSKYRDRAADETGEGMMALRGASGEVLWHNKRVSYGGPCLLWRGHILTNGSGGFALDLKTGQPAGWDYSRKYGCNTAVGSEHLLTFRSGAAGFYDLLGRSGTGNLGGFRSSCTNNLIPANGVLNAPDYTRTCSCSYQNQTSLALIHLPEAEFWTFGGNPDKRRIGVNFGAPGDRRSAGGTLFAEFPNLGSDPDKAKIRVEGDELTYRRIHSSLVEGEAAWIGASAAFGVKRIQLTPPPGLAKGSRCQIRLYFCELGKIEPGERVFDVRVQGKAALHNLDLASETSSRAVIGKDLPAIPTPDVIDLEFAPKTAAGATISGIEVVFEPVDED